MRLETFLTVQEFILYNCSAVCGLFARQLYGGVSSDLLQEGLCHRLCDPDLLHPETLLLGQATADPCLHPETPGHSWASLGQSFMGSLLLSPGSWCTQGFVCALQESVSPVLCKFWQLYGGVNGNPLQEGLCHAQVCCTQSPCRPLLIRTSAGNTQTQKLEMYIINCDVFK